MSTYGVDSRQESRFVFVERMNIIIKLYGDNMLSHIYNVEELECVTMRYLFCINGPVSSSTRS